MATRYDVITPRKGKEKTYWIKIGSAWAKEDGSFSVDMDALPLADAEGKCRFLIVPPKARDEAPARQAQRGAAPADLGDDIPFGMEWRG